MVAWADEDVLRLDVTMDQIGGVGRVQRLGDRPQEADHIGSHHCAVVHLFGECRALDEPHREIQLTVGLTGVIHRNDVRVIKGRDVLALTSEALTELLISAKARRQHLQRHWTAKAHVFRAVDDGHAANTDDVADAVTAEHRPRRENH